jgi:uncharacterized protein (TIGR02996 family)
MSDEDALLSAIAAHPHEDTPRLVYADWLDEHGQPVRAEFIRAQIEIARLELLPRAAQNAFVPVYRRHQQLLDDHRPELLGPLAPLDDVATIMFRRGFVSEIRLPVSVFLEHAALVAGQRPLPYVSVTRVVGRLFEFLRNPNTNSVASIHGWYSPSPDDHPPRDPVYAVDLVNWIEHLTRLEVLDLESCGVTDLYCDLADDFSVPSLREIDLSNNHITDDGVSNLLLTALPQQLTRLVLGGNFITDVGALALAERWPTGDADRLKDLNLRFTQIGQAGQTALLNRFGGRVHLF